MEKRDFIGSITLIIFGGIIFTWSLDYPFGEISNPGSAFVPQIAASILILASFITLIGSLKKENIEKEKVFATKRNLTRVVVAAALMFTYRLLFTIIGFTLTNLIFFLFASRLIGGFRWKTCLIFSLLVTGGSYLLFQRFLEIQMPGGILKL